MNMGEIITRFRQEHPEVTANVASDSVLRSWCEVGNLEIATKARLIKDDTTFSASIGVSKYSLTANIPNFYDIDEFPGGGVAYNNKRIDVETRSSLDEKRKSWRTASNGTPKDYYRRNDNIYLGTPPDAANDIQVDVVLKPDAFNDDAKTPFNEYTHLETYHYSLVLYLAMRVFMGKMKKKDPAMLAKQEYDSYVEWMKSEVNRGIYAPIQIRPPVSYKSNGRTRTRHR